MRAASRCVECRYMGLARSHIPRYHPASLSRCIKGASVEGKTEGTALSCSRKARRTRLPCLITRYAAASRCIKVASTIEGKTDGIALSCSRKARHKELFFLTTSYPAASWCIKVSSIEGKTEGIALSCSKKASGKT